MSIVIIYMCATTTYRTEGDTQILEGVPVRKTNEGKRIGVKDLTLEELQ